MNDPVKITRNAVAELAEQNMLLQLIIIIAATRLVAWLIKRWGQAEVVGEMLAGIMLGPSLFGYFAPDAFSYIFAASSGPLFSGFAQTGLVLLMFQIGLEFELSKSATAKRTIALVSLLGMVTPLLLGGLTSIYFYEQLAGSRPDQLSFTLFFAVSMSITALPVLGRIFLETGLGTTRAGVIALSAAAINDVLGWMLLGAVSLLVAGNFALSWVAARAIGILLIGAVAFGVVRPLAQRYFNARLVDQRRLDSTSISIVLVLLFGCALLTSHLGLHALIGGFILGVSLHQHRGFVAEWQTQIAPLVNTFFLPIFFAYTGLRTDIGVLQNGTDALQCLAICTIAFLGKYGGGYVGARLAGEPHRMAHVLGVCMNTRGLMELVVLNIGLDIGILPRSIFTQLVYMAVITTLMATPLMRRYLRAEAALARS